MKPCFNTITAGRDKPLEEIIAACGSARFAGIEIDLNHLDAAAERGSLKEIKTRLEDSNLQPASIMAFDLAPLAENNTATERFRRGVEAAEQLGAPILLVYCATNVPAGMDPAKAREKAIARTKEYAQLAQSLKVGLEPIGRTTLMGRPEDALQIAVAAGASNAGVVMDTFHFYRAGVTDITPYPLDEFLMVHVNDAEDLPIEKLTDANRLHLGLGILPLPQYLGVLAAKKYSGFLSIEIFRPEYWQQPVTQVVNDAKTSYEKLLATILQ
jgi:2-keto-myo-inositol isomerase